MYDRVATDRTPLASQRGETMPIGTPRRQGPESREGFAQRSPIGRGLVGAHSGLYRPVQRTERLIDAGPLLIRAIIRYLGRDAVDLQSAQQTPWVSITFSGARHVILFSVCADTNVKKLKRCLSAMSEDELPFSGHIVADIQAHLEIGEDGAEMVRVEALTVVSD